MSNSDDISVHQIVALKTELEEKDKNLILAAQYGKDLLEQNAELHTRMEMLIQEHDIKVETLEQERYSLSMKLEAKERTLNSLTSELETQENLYKDQIRKLSKEAEDQNLKLNKKISSYESKVESFEKEIILLKEKAEDLQGLLEQFQQQQHEASILNVSNNFEEYTSQLQYQLNCLSLEKQDLEKEVVDLKSVVKSSSLNLKRREGELERLQSDLEEKECQMTSMYNEIERAKSENEELKMEIDHMKFDETNVKKKGNSLFAELEDNRQALEKHVISLTSKLSTVKKQCEIKSQQVGKLKLHVASLLSMTTNAADLQYQKHLEDALGTTKTQLNAATNKCKEYEEKLEKLQHLDTNLKIEAMDKQRGGNYVKYLYEESQNQVKSLEEEVRSMCFAKISLNDQNLQLKRKLHQSEKNREASNSEVLRLNVKMEELMLSKGISNAVESESPAGQEEFYYEKLEDLKQELPKDEKEPLKEIIVGSSDGKEPLTTIIKKEMNKKEPLEEENKENRLSNDVEFTNKGIRKDKKGVAFAIDEKEEPVRKPQKLEKPVKPRRKMEVPIIRENPDAQSADCKVQ